MLVLTRKKQESIRIGNDIEVVVLDVGRNRVRLGFRCPPHISVKREELANLEVEIPLGEGVTAELVCV
ncbi:carbon storage regulator [Planctomicrobium sp. SH664]|uniref:carbon storage regulator n=1 Tax=Planctomicrobium sp. SH664 TaxID=3448125 RepID=UPI003F5B8BBB